MNTPPDPSLTPPTAWRRSGLAWLLIALGLAAALRIAHLDWGLRQTPHADEQYFVRNAVRMLRTGSFDHGFYEYPGLLFYLLVPVVALGGARQPPGPDDYLAARALIACFGVVSVALVAAFGRRLAGGHAALVAAGLLAVSPVHVETAHRVRPDVALEALTLLALWSYLTLGTRWQHDARAGLATGLAVGLKFSGGLLALPFVVQRLLRPGPRLRGLLLAGALGLLVFALVSPYALLAPEAFTGGVGTQLAYHYQEVTRPVPAYIWRVLGYAAVWPKAFGLGGALAALAGLLLVLRRAPRAWLPFLLLPVLTALVFGSTHVHFDRHMLPSSGIVALLAGVACQALSERRHLLGLALTGVLLVQPLAGSLDYLHAIGRPGTRDRALDWLDAQPPGRGRVLTDVPGLAPDPERFELQYVRFFGPLADWQARSADFVVSIASEERAGRFAGLPISTTLTPANAFEGPALHLRPVPASAQTRYLELPLEGAQVRASDNAQALPAVHDGQLDTFWDAPLVAGSTPFLEVRFPEPVVLARVELLLGTRPFDAGRRLRLAASLDGTNFAPLESARGRPAIRKQLGAGDDLSEVLLCAPTPLRALRIERPVEPGTMFPRWSVAELRVERLAP